MEERTYIAIDLKSFYASAECVSFGYDPLDTNLVVADTSRSDKTICLAVTPALKSYGIPGRIRLFELKQKVEEINASRRLNAPRHRFSGSSCSHRELERNKALELDFLIAKPRMAYYIEKSSEIYQIYLKYISPEDIHVYSIDEVFIDATDYLKLYKMSARELAMTIILDILGQTGITATAGVGTNLYLAKVAMDIMAKHIPADKNGVRIAELDEMSYREKLWSHTPLTDFWRVGRGYAKRLKELGLNTMGDIALCSEGKDSEYLNEELLFKTFGVNAELLIDHAWGYESCTMKDIKSYKPENESLGSGQVLQCPYSFEKAKIVIQEMADSLSLDLVSKRLVTNQITITVGYDIANIDGSYKGDVKVDFYGRMIPKHAHGTLALEQYTASTKIIVDAATKIFDSVVDKSLFVRRLNITASKVVREDNIPHDIEQLDLFTDYEQKYQEDKEIEKKLKKERSMQETLLEIKQKYGKNSILRGLNFEDGATQKDRNRQIGGHNA